MKKTILFLTMLFSMISRINASNGIPEKSNMESQPLLFIENKGQVADMQGNLRPDILFTTHSKGVKLFFTKTGISYQFQKTEYPDGYNRTDNKREADIELEKKIKTYTYRMDMELIGANPNPTIIKEGKTEYFENYYLAHCPNGIHNVASYTKVTYQNIYPNIDWVVYTKGQEMKYDFVVHPGGNTDMIQVRYKDAEDIKIGEDGSLLLTTRLGEVIDQKPISFQNGKIVVSHFNLSNNVVKYKVEEFNKSMDLVIDPGLIWSTYYGGSGDEIGSVVSDATNIANDANGNIYLAGCTNSTVAIASGGFQNSFSGVNLSAYLVKFNSSGSRLWGTYYGSDYTEANSVATDLNGNVYLAGSSQNGSLSSGGFQNTYSGSYDAFLVKFNSSGSRLWATYYGGTNYELGTDVVTDAMGNVFLAGWTASSSNIASGGHLNSFAGGNADAYLVKFNSSGSRLWGTYYGGSGDDNYFNDGNIVSTDANGNVYLFGTTKSTTGISASGFQNTLNGNSDAFVVKFNPNGSRLWGTYYGGAGGETGKSIINDANGNIYIVGSASNLTTTEVTSTGFNNTTGNGYIAKFDSVCNRIWGRKYELIGNGVDLDANGNIYITGSIDSTINLNAGGYQSSYGGGATDAALAKFDNSGNLIGATYFGGIGSDKGNVLLVDQTSNVYMTGTTSSPANIANGGFQNVYGGGTNGDAYIAKFSSCAFFGPQITPQSITVCPGQNTTLSISGGLSYQWSTGATTASITVTPNQATTYTVTVNGNGCTSTSSRTVNIYTNTGANISADGIITPMDTISSGDVVQLQLNAPLNAIPNIQWTPPTSISNTSISNPLVYPNSTINYTATYTDTNGCTQNKTISIYVKPLTNIGTVGVLIPATFSLLDTLFIKVQLTSINDLYGLFMKLKANAEVSTYLNYAGYKADTLLGTGSGILSTPPTVSNGVYDFGITKVGASSGYSGSGLFYTLKFVTKNVVIPNGTNFCFYVDDISATNSSGNQVGLTNQGLYCTSFNEQVLVWPGDLNNNKIVTTADILPIGYFYNSTGPARSNASIQWVGQPATLWGYGQGSTNGSAYKVFADANGDGIISNADQTAIGFNIGKNHALTIKKDHHERSGFDGALVLTMTPSVINTTQLPQTNNIKVELKNDNGALNSFYGISFEIQIDSTIFDPSTATFDYTGSIFGATPGTDFLKVEYATASTISVGMTRYANAAINGNGLLCNISVKTQPTISGGNTSTIVKGYVEEANDAQGQQFVINDDSLYTVAITLNNGINELSEEQLGIYPNPVSKTLHIETKERINEVMVFDALGHLVFTLSQPKNNNIDVSRLSSGVYIAEIKTENGIAKRRWVKE